MSTIDAAYESLQRARAETASQASAKAGRVAAALSRARSQVFGTTSHVVGASSVRDDLDVQYCSTCPCIFVARNDGKGNAARISIEMRDETAFMSLPGHGWVDVETNAQWLRSALSTCIAADIADRPLGMTSLQKTLLWGVLAIAMLPVGYFILLPVLGAVIEGILGILMIPLVLLCVASACK